MPVKIARSAPRPSFGLPELLVAIHTSRQSCYKAGKSANIHASSGVIRGIPAQSRPLLHSHSKPGIEWHLRKLRQNLQARLCSREPSSGCDHRTPADRRMVLGLQRKPSPFWAQNALPKGVHASSTTIALCPVKRGQLHLSWRLAHGHQRKTPPQVGPARGFQRAVRLGGLSPGLRTERRAKDDTPKRKMMRARLPSIAKGLIQFECGTDTTVGAIPGPQSTATHQTDSQGWKA